MIESSNKLRFVAIIFRSFFYLLGFYIFAVFLFFLFQGFLFYSPRTGPFTPAVYRVSAIGKVHFPAKDGVELYGWYYPARKLMPTILFFHGEDGFLPDRLPMLKPYISKGYGVFLIEYRGYGELKGAPSEAGLYSDARGAMEFIQEKGVPPKCFILYGESVGASIAAKMASEYSIGGLVMVYPFASLVKSESKKYPVLPIGFLWRDKFDTVSHAEKVRVPTVIFEGANNIFSPKGDALEILLKIKSHKELIKINDKDNPIPDVSDQVDRFFHDQGVCAW